MTAPAAHGRGELVGWLREDDPSKLAELFARADAVRARAVGAAVHLRGLIEFSNHCRRACSYCGINAGMKGLVRYRMSRAEIVDLARIAAELGYGTVVLQSGEDPGMSAQWLADAIAEIKDRLELAVTIGAGERPLEDYRRWREAGADRYLLKFETSNPELYRQLHPPLPGGGPSRLELLVALRELGYQIGGGVMLGLPGQTLDDLAQDLETFARLDLDMIGSGPYIPHPATPLGQRAETDWAWAGKTRELETLTYKFIALTRLSCPQANLPATTALATINRASGYIQGLRAGANVIMPNLTPIAYRDKYEIYPGRAVLSQSDVHQRVLASIAAAGRTPGRGRGDRLGP